jgi:hypothetical protein
MMMMFVESPSDQVVVPVLVALERGSTGTLEYFAVEATYRHYHSNVDWHAVENHLVVPRHTKKSWDPLG